MPDDTITQLLELQGDASGGISALKDTSTQMLATEQQAERTAQKVTSFSQNVAAFLANASSSAEKFSSSVTSGTTRSAEGLSRAASKTESLSGTVGDLLTGALKLPGPLAAVAAAVAVIGDKSEGIKKAKGLLDELKTEVGGVFDVAANPAAAWAEGIHDSLKHVGLDIGFIIRDTWFGTTNSKALAEAAEKAAKEAADVAASTFRQELKGNNPTDALNVLAQAPELGQHTRARIFDESFEKNELDTLDRVGKAATTWQLSLIAKLEEQGQHVDAFKIRIPNVADQLQGIVAEALKKIQSGAEDVDAILTQLGDSIPDENLKRFVVNELQAYAAAQQLAKAQDEAAQATKDLVSAQRDLATKEDALKKVVSEQAAVRQANADNEKELLPLSDSIRDMEQEKDKILISQEERRSKLVDLTKEQKVADQHVRDLEADQAKQLAALEPLRKAVADATDVQRQKALAVRDAEDKIYPLLQKQKEQHQELADLQERIVDNEKKYTSAVDDASAALDKVNAGNAECERTTARALKSMQDGVKSLGKEIGDAEAKTAAAVKQFVSDIEAENAGMLQNEKRSADGVKAIEENLATVGKQITAQEEARNAALKTLQENYDGMSGVIEERQRKAVAGIKELQQAVDSLARSQEDRQRGAAEALRVMGENLDKLKSEIAESEQATQDQLQAQQEGLTNLTQTLAASHKVAQDAIRDAQRGLDDQIKGQEDLEKAVDARYADELTLNKGIIKSVTEKWKTELDGARAAQREAEKLASIENLKNDKNLLAFEQ